MASRGDASPGAAPAGDVDIAHDAGARRFVARERRAVVGHIAYALAADGTLDLQHTIVEPASRGHGVGEALVRAAFAHARGAGVRVIPSCPFVGAYLDDHPDERDVVDAGVA